MRQSLIKQNTYYVLNFVLTLNLQINFVIEWLFFLTLYKFLWVKSTQLGDIDKLTSTKGCDYPSIDSITIGHVSWKLIDTITLYCYVPIRILFYKICHGRTVDDTGLVHEPKYSLYTLTPSPNVSSTLSHTNRVPVFSIGIPWTQTVTHRLHSTPFGRRTF